MELIKYTTALKASGDEYRKIVFWNRFIRNKLELVLSLLPALLSIVLFSYGFRNPFTLIIYVIFWVYPIYIFIQFRKTVNFHLKNRASSESAPCEITFMPNGILAEIPEYDITEVYYWNDFTTIYDKLGYYMMFNKGTMRLMLRKADIPDNMKENVLQYMKENVDQNICLFKF